MAMRILYKWVDQVIFFKPFKPNGLSNSYQLDQSNSNSNVLGGIIFSSSKFQLKILSANSEDPDQTPHYALSDLDLRCLPVSHKKDARLI